MPPTLFYSEIMGQAVALGRLLEFYSGPEGRARLKAVPPASQPILLGMGASFHSALMGAHHLRHLGVNGQAVEATDVLNGDTGSIAEARPLLYISQSGFSGEIQPLLEDLPGEIPLVALTNDEHSPLARRAQVVLPLLAGDEQTVATKTYVNSLATLWLLARQWAGTLDAAAFDALRRVREHMAGQLAEGTTQAARWAETLGGAQTFVYIGAGQHAITARQSAMMTMEWLKLPALSSSVGAFRHGPLEITQPGVGVVIFATPGPAYDSSHRLAQTLQSYGASVLMVQNGRVYSPDELPGSDGVPPAEYLSPLADVVPVQFFIEALARERGISPGFRYIDKVTAVL